MKRIRSKNSESTKRVVRFVRTVPALVLAGTVFLGGGMTAKATTLADVFDAKQYAEDYADLKAAFGDDEKLLLKHYLEYGIKEERKVSGLIDVVAYRAKYADLDEAFGDNWDAYVNHFLTYGIYEKRNSGTDFNALDYAERYVDLKEAFGDDVLALYKYDSAGKYVKRKETNKKPDGTVSSMSEYDAAGNKTKYTYYVDNGNWSESERVYNNSNIKVKETETYHNADGSYSVTVNEYDDSGNKVKRTYKSYNADDQMNFEKEEDGDGNELSSAWYYPNGNIRYETKYDKEGNRTFTGYNEDGTMKSEEIYYVAGGYRTKFRSEDSWVINEYDSNNIMRYLEKQWDDGRKRITKFDENGNPIADIETDAEGNENDLMNLS